MKYLRIFMIGLVFFQVFLSQNTFAHDQDVDKNAVFKEVEKLEQAKKTDANSSAEKIGGDFTLTNFLGKPTQLKDFQGKVVILNFGYTHCPDVCPVILNNLNQILKKLGSDAKNVQTLFITIDPAKDTPTVLKKYLANFNPSFLGLSGSAAELAKVASQYQTIYFKQNVPNKDGSKTENTLIHSSFIYLIDKKGQMKTQYISEEWDQMLPEIKELLAEK